MKNTLFLYSFLLSQILMGQILQAQDQNLARDIHEKAILIDTHNDILTQVMEKGVIMDHNLIGITQSDLARFKQGGLDVQIFSVWSDGNQSQPFAFALRQMDTLDAVCRRNPDKIVEVRNSKELLKVVREHKIAAMFGVEGGHMIENDLGKLDSLYRRGTRYMTLTWNNSTPWASSAFDERFTKNLSQKGLNDFGKQVVSRMNQLGMIVDISHVGEQTFWGVMKVTTKPVIASHSSVYSFNPHQRNLKDEQIKAVAKNKGVIQINFFSGFLDSTYDRKYLKVQKNHQKELDSLVSHGMPDHRIEGYLFSHYPKETDSLRAPISLLMKHLEYIIKLVGVDYVGIGSDYDGMPAPPKLLDDVTTYPLITQSLLEKGYSKKDIYKILGGNFLRVLKANEKGTNNQ